MYAIQITQTVKDDIINNTICDSIYDIFAGFKIETICNSQEDAIQIINSYDISLDNIKCTNYKILSLVNKLNPNLSCYTVTVFNIQELIFDEIHNDFRLPNNIYLRIDFENGLHYVFKDNNMYKRNITIFYVYKILKNSGEYYVKFINCNKSFHLQLDIKTNIFTQVDK